jgi:hypothetical protein
MNIQSIKKVFKESALTIVTVIVTPIMLYSFEKYPVSLNILIYVSIFAFYLMFLHFHKERKRKIKEDKFQQYLIENEGSNYFLYRGNKKNRNFIEEKILKRLDSNINILFKKAPIENDFERHIYNEIYNHRIDGGYPFLVKIRNQKVEAVSINILVNETNKNIKTIDDVLDFMKRFY